MLQADSPWAAAVSECTLYIRRYKGYNALGGGPGGVKHAETTTTALVELRQRDATSWMGTGPA